MCTRVLASLALLVRVAHCFSWDIVEGRDKQLNFFKNGNLVHVEDIPVANEISAVTYDAAQDRVLFADYREPNTSIYSFHITTRKIQHVVTRRTYYYTNSYISSLAYDPVTQLLFWLEGVNEIYRLSLKSASSNKGTDAILFVSTHAIKLYDMAVDSCGRFLYWITDYEIERGSFDGSKREVLVDYYQVGTRRLSMAIDQQTQRMYWIEATVYQEYSIKSADLNGKNKTTLYDIGAENNASSLSVSTDFIFWKSDYRRAVFQLQKCQQNGVESIVYSKSTKYQWRHAWKFQVIAAKYTITEQTLGIQGCEALKNTSSDSANCYNYCVYGNCSVGAEGQPKCSCEAGFSGERCEVNVCYKHCLNGGVCSLSEEEPVCQCPADYEGDRCNVATTQTGVCACADKTTQQIFLEVKHLGEDLVQCSTLQLDSNKLDENAAKLQICEESMKNDLQNLDETTSKTQT